MIEKLAVVLSLCFVAVPHAHARTFKSFEQAFLNPAAVTILSVTGSDRKMKHLPAKLGTLVNLKVLKLACLEQLEDLPEDIGKLVNLEELILDNGNGCRMNVSIPEEDPQSEKIESSRFVWGGGSAGTWRQGPSAGENPAERSRTAIESGGVESGEKWATSCSSAGG